LEQESVDVPILQTGDDVPDRQRRALMQIKRGAAEGAVVPFLPPQPGPRPGAIRGVVEYMPVVRNSVGLVPKKRRKTLAK